MLLLDGPLYLVLVLRHHRLCLNDTYPDIDDCHALNMDKGPQDRSGWTLHVEKHPRLLQSRERISRLGSEHSYAELFYLRPPTTLECVTARTGSGISHAVRWSCPRLSERLIYTCARKKPFKLSWRT